MKSILENEKPHDSGRRDAFVLVTKKINWLHFPSSPNFAGKKEIRLSLAKLALVSIALAWSWADIMYSDIHSPLAARSLAPSYPGTMEGLLYNVNGG